jgi:hypothetical protein
MTSHHITTPHRCEPRRTQFFAKLLSTENWASILCSRRSGPSIWQSNGSRRLRQKTAVQSKAGDWWRQRNYSWEWCVPRGPGNNGGSGVTNIRRRRRRIHLILILYETDPHLPAWFPTKWNVSVAFCARHSGSSCAATRNLAWFLLHLYENVSI